MAEGVVGGDEEPGVAAGRHDRLAGAVGERPCVIGPVDRIGRAFVAGERRTRGPGDQEDLVLFLDDLVDGERHARIRDIDDHVDAVDVEPLPGHVGTDIGLVLVIGGHDLDRRLAHLAAEVLNRHLCGYHRTLAGEIGIEARLVVEHADLDHVARHLGMRRRVGGNNGDSGQYHASQLDHLSLLLLRLQSPGHTPRYSCSFAWLVLRRSRGIISTTRPCSIR